MLLATHSDIFAFLSILSSLLIVLGSRIRTATKTDCFLTLFCLTFFSVMLFGSFYYLVLSQFLIWHESKGNAAQSFEALLPLDFNAELSFADISSFLEGSGKNGRQFYLLYLLIDTMCLICLTIFNRQLFSLTYPLNPSSGESLNFLVKFATQRFPLFLASLDLYENLCLSWITLNWPNLKESRGLQSFIERISVATRVKLVLTCLLVGMHISGIIQLFLTTPGDKEPKKSSSVKKGSKKPKND